MRKLAALLWSELAATLGLLSIWPSIPVACGR